MPYLQSSIPYFKAWVRREYTKNLEEYHGEFLHAMVIGVTTMPNRTLSFQVIFTQAVSQTLMIENIHGGAMWARMPLTALVADTPLEEWPTELPPYLAQPWDCMSHTHSVYKLERATPAPWIAKVDGEFYPAKYYFTVDYTDNEVADDPAQHKQSHVLELLDAGEYTGNIVALPNNRVRVTHPAWFETGEGAPDFKPNQHIYNSKENVDYVWDTQRVFNNLYSEEEINHGNAWNENAKSMKKGYAAGGLKTPGANQTGLKKLPKAVRNQMGYMNKGGMPKKKGYAGGAA